MTGRKRAPSLASAISSRETWFTLLNRKGKLLIPVAIFLCILLWLQYPQDHLRKFRGSYDAPRPWNIDSVRTLEEKDKWWPSDTYDFKQEYWRDFQRQNYSISTNELDPGLYRKWDPYKKPESDAESKPPPVSCIGPRGKRMEENDEEWVHAYFEPAQSYPEPTFGLYDELGLNKNVYLDRFGRHGPYGQTNTWRLSSAPGKIPFNIKWANIDWHALQQQCIHDNRARFDFDPRTRPEDPYYQKKGHSKSDLTTKRTAIVIRSYSHQDWFSELMANIRSVIMEMSIGSGGEYEVFILYHMKDLDRAVDEMLPDEVQSMINAKVPKEFQNMIIPWNEQMWATRYPQIPEDGQRIHVGQWFPMQYFQHVHPEFDFYLNWETDVRYTGHFYDLIDKSREWAKKQKRYGLWERNARWYIPAYHGSYENFAKHVESRYLPHSIQSAPHGIIWGPHKFFPDPYDRKQGPYFQDYSRPFDPKPPKKVNHEWGIGEEADLITFNPIFDPRWTNYAMGPAWWNYDERLRERSGPERRATIITFMRLSHRLLATMEYDNTHEPVRHMSSEQWPQTVALYSGLKAVYVPHPVFMLNQWPAQAVDFIFNNGDQQSVLDREVKTLPATGAGSGGPDSVFGLGREHNLFWQSTFYYRASLSMTLYRWWYGQNVSSSSWQITSDDYIGGPEWEKQQGGHFCLPPMLLHPIKDMAKKDPVPYVD